MGTAPVSGSGGQASRGSDRQWDDSRGHTAVFNSWWLFSRLWRERGIYPSCLFPITALFGFPFLTVLLLINSDLYIYIFQKGKPRIWPLFILTSTDTWQGQWKTQALSLKNPISVRPPPADQQPLSTPEGRAKKQSF